MRVVMDTSALISLELLGALEKSLAIIEITIPEAVKGELEEIQEYGDAEGKAAKRILEMIKKNVVETAVIKDKKRADSMLSKDINRGEAECFACCVETGIKRLVMDDVDAAYSLEGLAIANEIKIKISIAVLMELYKKRAMNKQQFKDYVNKLVKIREWEGGALEFLANKYLEHI